jgi:hypothetical protein
MGFLMTTPECLNALMAMGEHGIESPQERRP